MIGVFDSGLGGLTILSTVRTHLPDVPLCYVADHAYTPYGNLTADCVQTRSKLITQWLIDQGCSLVVVACNTATAIAIDRLREDFSIPIVGVEPAVKPAAIKSKTQKIGILATENTVTSGRYLKLLERFLPQASMISEACTGLADAIEQNSPQIDALLARYCEPLVNQGVDQIVLGCTHYPLVKDRIAQYVGADISIVDASEAVAMEVRRRYSMLNRENPAGIDVRLFTTGSWQKFEQAIQHYESLRWLQGAPFRTLTL